ncbi:tetratricopeptide repeat protein [Aestuariispira insulae]|uniref:protein O-GlcNAc transferase n=1 Tax=Aestuariispira insulae TaxID=1461337 RepID=A0A3D9HP58_9PROT|nr:tetratricopeptide repeat protein [Aestuariispira insulae]RED51284.1 putative O-linked N-acetylglucosamine transferase (SPINDLY family) [Aestuariispira insulae]
MSDETEISALMAAAEAAIARNDGAVALNRLNAVLAKDPSHEAALHKLAELAYAVGRHDLSLQYMNRLVAAYPDHAGYCFQLGALLLGMGDHEAGENAIRRTLLLDPDHEAARITLGNRLKDQGLLEEAADQYKAVLRASPDLTGVQSNLASVLTAQGRHEEAARLYDDVIAKAPDLQMAQSNRLMNMNYRADCTVQEIADAHKAWGRAFPTPAAPDFDADPDRRLHVAYLSPDFRNHPVIWFFHALIRFHDRQKVRVTCLSNLGREDEKTDLVKGLADGWHRIDQLDDQALVDLIRKEKIDILVDLAGHTGNNRLTVMARKPAPLQMTWLGYPNSTGLPQIDYRIVDAVTDPPGAEAFHSERLIRLENGFLCFTPPDGAPDVAPLPMLENGYCTFASFNNLAKVTRQVVGLWSEILHKVPGSKLIIKARSLDDPGTRARYLKWFATEGIAPERLDLKGRLPGAWDHLNLYNQADIALDTFPYNGTTTTCEALYMGLPVLALAGDRHAARVSASLLTRLGYSNLISDTKQELVEKASALAADPVGLAQMRAGTRPRLLASPLCDGPAFAHSMEAAYRDAWQKHCWEATGELS